MSKRNFTDSQLMTVLLKYSEDHSSMTLESMALLKFDLIYLESYLKSKGVESKLRGKEPSKEYMNSIETVKRAHEFISTYCLKLEQMESALQEQARQLEYYRSVQPRVDFSKFRLKWNGVRVKYIKDFVKPIETDNF